MLFSVRLGLKSKFILYVSILIIVIMLVISYTSIKRDSEIIVDKLVRTGQVLSVGLAQRTYDPMIRNDYKLIEEYVEEIAKYDDVSKVVILDDEYKCIASSDSKLLTKIVSGPIFKKLEKSQKNMDYFEGSNAILFGAPLKEKDDILGTVIIQISKDSMKKEITKTKKAVFFITVLAILLGSAVSYALAKFIIEPLLRLVEGTKIIAGGNLTHKIEVSTGDEIEFLSSSFNNMTDTIRSNVDELQQTNSLLDKKLYEVSLLFGISQDLNIISDSHELLNVILVKTCEAIGASKATLLFLNENTDRFEIKYSLFGLNELELENIQILNQLCSEVMSTEKPVCVPDVSSVEKFKPLFIKGKKKLRSLMAAPVLRYETFHGVFILINKNNGNFKDEDLQLLTTIASSAAIAVEKIKIYDLAIRDEASNAYNSRYFDLRLIEEVSRCRRMKSSVSILSIQVKANDSVTAGLICNQVIRDISIWLNENFRRSFDIIARYTTDTILILLPETGKKGMNTVLEKAETGCNKIFKAISQAGDVHYQLGYAIFPEDGENVNSLITISTIDRSLEDNV